MRAIVVPRLWSVLFDVAVAVAVAALTPLSTVTVWLPAAIQLPGYVMAAALLGRRRWPLAAMAVVGAAALSQVLFVRPRMEPVPYDVAVVIAMYSAVKYGRTMLDAWLAAGVVAIGIGIEVRHRGGTNWWMIAMFYVAVCGGLWLAGYTVRARRIYLAGLEERAATLEREREHLTRLAVADERAMIARELHDVVAHSLAVMIVQADGGRYALGSDPQRTRAALTTVADTGREALEDMRQLIGVLRGTDGDEPAGDTLGDRRRFTVDELDTLVERARHAGLSVEMRCEGTPPALNPAVELAVYRIVQEALTNVLRHAGREAKVTLSIRYRPDAVTLSVVDDGGDGRAAHPTAAGGGRAGHPAAAGNGLVGMRERVAVHRGKFSAGPRLDGGWAVEATIPFAEAVARP